MEKSVSIDYLKNYPHIAPVVGGWLFTQWGHHIEGDTLSAACKRVAGRLNDDRLPLSLIALIEGEPVGTASLFQHDMDTRPELSPWLAGVFVKDGRRNLGVGSKLVSAAEEAAKKLCIGKLYLFTPDKQSFYGRRGWSFFEETQFRGGRVTIMAKTLLR